MKKTIIYALCSLALSVVVISSAPAVANAERFSNDVAISNAVRAGLDDDIYMETREINVFTEQGKVTLEGEVTNSAQVNRATHITVNTPGVRIVDNQLKVTN